MTGNHWLDLTDVFEKYLEPIHLIIKLLHLDNMLRMDSKLRIALFCCCIIALGFAVAWFADVYTLQCFTRTPWNDHGIGYFTCILQVFGCVVFARLFYLSGMALAYYDDSGAGELRKKKVQLRHELKRQCREVLERASRMTREVNQLFSDNLKSDIRNMILEMWTLLDGMKDQKSARDFVKQTAKVLEDLRRPMLVAFRSLPLADQGHVEKILKQQSSYDMEYLVTFKQNHRNLSVDQDASSDQTAPLRLHEGGYQAVEAGGPDESAGGSSPTAGYSHRAQSTDGGGSTRLPALRGARRALSLPTEEDLAVEALTPATIRKNPEKVVLQILDIVMKWVDRASVPDHEEREVTDLGAPARLSMVYYCWNSEKFRGLLWGNLFCFLYCCFYLVTLHDVVTSFMDGECDKFHERLQCVATFGRKGIALFFMVVYIVSMTIVMYNFQCLDAVMQEHMEVSELQKFKSELDSLNTYSLSKEADTVAIFREVSAVTNTMKDTVAAFLRATHGGEVQQETYSRLVQDIEARTPNVTSNRYQQMHFGGASAA